MLESGTLLGGRYEIEKRIGSGGMADVYKALDHKLNRRVAVKVLKAEFREDSKFVSKFKVEAQSAAGLMHPNIVNVYDVGDDQGVSYMVMELVEGITLKDYIDRRGRLSAKETISIAIQVSNGIQTAHKNHIIHRDIKPQNIIISREGKVKVTDFGIARAATSNTISSNAMGSVHYASPEQARGGYSDAKSDIYSLGITMYEMLTGDVPFDGDSTVTIALKHLQEEMVPPSKIVPDIPYSLEQIVMKCCQKNPDLRYQNMEELIGDLKLSLVNPNGHFVHIQQVSGDETIFFDQNEMEAIRKYDRHSNDDEQNFGYDEDDDEGDEDEDNDYAGFDDEYRNRDRDVNPKMKKVTKILLIVVIVLIAAMAVFFVGRAVGLFSFGSGSTSSEESGKVTVPNFLGKTFEEAKTEAKKVGLGVKKAGTEKSDQYDTDQVCKQSVAAGEEVEKNTTIELTISSGLSTEGIAVPKVVGYTQEQAEQMLTEAGFVVNSEFKQSSDVEAGIVISQSPEADKTAGKGATVTITVSTGKGTVEVPDLTGKTKDEATQALNSVGLKPGTISEENSSTVEKGLVITQGTAAGKSVKQGSTVAFTISKGDIAREDQVWKCNANIDLSPYDGSYPVTIVLTQIDPSTGSEQETTIVEGQTVSNPYSLSVTGISGADSGTVTIYNAETGETIGTTHITFTRVN